MTLTQLWLQYCAGDDMRRAYYLTRPVTTLADALYDARSRSGVSQNDLSAAAGVAVQEIDRIETCGGDPKLSTITALAHALGLTVRVVLEPLNEDALQLLGAGQCLDDSARRSAAPDRSRPR